MYSPSEKFKIYEICINHFLTETFNSFALEIFALVFDCKIVLKCEIAWKITSHTFTIILWNYPLHLNLL